MKRWQILVFVVAVLAVGLAGCVVDASRQTTGSAVDESAGDCTDDGWEPDNNFYQPKKRHFDWDLGDPDPWD